MKRWTVNDSREQYLINKWGKPYFDINDEGNVSYSPRTDTHSIDLKALVGDLRRRGIHPPILLRLNDILEARVAMLRRSFSEAALTYDAPNRYLPAYPIKVNQQRHVVEQLVNGDENDALALEAGSKPELLVALAHQRSGGTIICNGYKDAEYIETALLAQKLSFNILIVIDRKDELPLILDAAKRTGTRPNLGVRVKLTTRGAGRWEESSGDSSKFGLSASELMDCVNTLRNADALDTLKLLHFHIGSQITAIRSVKDAVREASRVYCELYALGASSLHYLDVGGGLAVDYDGSQTNFHSSKNYSVQEYANDIVSTVRDATDSAQIPSPTIVTESGRALVAHHAVLVFDVLGTHRHENRFDEKPPPPVDGDPDILHAIHEAYSNVSKKNYQECYNDAVQVKDECRTLFAHGVIDLALRARIEDLFWATLRRIQNTVRELDYVPDDLKDLDKALASTYYCNFSVFQSLPDSWAVGQLFPIMPLHRLNEEPTLDGIIADLTCDSDGKVNQFIDLRDVKNTLRLHDKHEREPYYLGAFLVGAYQETLGDLHNLFGDTHAVHVTLDEDGGYRLEHLVRGDTVDEVLTYVEYEPRLLIHKVREAAEAAVRRGDFTFEQSAQFMQRFEKGLTGYTYLSDGGYSERRRATDLPHTI